METIKDIAAVVLGGRLVVDGKGRTFAKLPVWLAVLAAFSSPQLAVVTVLLIVAFGMKVQLAKA